MGLERFPPSDPSRSPVPCRWEILIPKCVMPLISRIIKPYLSRQRAIYNVLSKTDAPALIIYSDIYTLVVVYFFKFRKKTIPSAKPQSFFRRQRRILLINHCTSRVDRLATPIFIITCILGKARKNGKWKKH